MTEQEALDRARVMMGNGSATFMMATVDGDGKPRMRWMGAIAQDPDDENTYYMASQSTARKVAQLTGNPATQLVFGEQDFSCIATVNGKSEMTQDMAIKRMVWDALPGAAQYFDGPESEGFGVIKFTAESIEVLCLSEGREPVRVDLTSCC